MNLRQHLEESLSKALGRPVVVRGEIPTEVFEKLTDADQRALAARLIDSIRGKEEDNGSIDSLIGIAIGIKHDGTAQVIDEVDIDEMECPHEKALADLRVLTYALAATLLRAHAALRVRCKDDADKLIAVREALMATSPDSLKKLLDKLGKD